MDTVMSEEDKAEMEAAAGGEAPPPPTSLNGAATTGVAAEVSSTGPLPASASSVPSETHTSLAHHSSFSSNSPSGSATTTKDVSQGPPKDKKGKPKLTTEQRAKLDALEVEKDKNKKIRHVPKSLSMLQY
jgi:hypothetical protein